MTTSSRRQSLWMPPGLQELTAFSAIPARSPLVTASTLDTIARCVKGLDCLQCELYHSASGTLHARILPSGLTPSWSPFRMTICPPLPEQDFECSIVVGMAKSAAPA